MPVDFLTNTQKENYATFPKVLSAETVHKYFHLDDHDRDIIKKCRRDYNKLGYAIQLSTVRFIGCFLPNPLDVPQILKDYLVDQLGIKSLDTLDNYLARKLTRYEHLNDIKQLFGYCEFNNSNYFRLSRWLYAGCWYGSERPSIIFDRTVTWLLERKILLPGITTLTRLISQVRAKCSERLWRILSSLPSSEQIEKLENLVLSQICRVYGIVEFSTI